MDKKATVEINGTTYNVKKQYEAALRILKKDKFKNALEIMRPIAEIPQSVRNTASTTVKHFIDMSRAMTLKIGVGTRSAQNSGWLPEAIVSIAQTNNGLNLSPNPTNEQFDITLPKAITTFTFLTHSESSFLVNILRGSQKSMFTLGKTVFTWFCFSTKRRIKRRLRKSWCNIESS